MNHPEAEEREWPRESKHAAMCDCPDCGSAEKMHPVWWEPVEGDQRKWKVGMVCVECFARYRGVFSEEQIDDFDEALDDGARKLADELRSLERANMTDEAERFIKALAADAIGPEYFEAT